MIIAVYGTLKSNKSNYSHFLSKSKCISKNAETVDKFAMYSSGIPYVVPSEHKTPISVELYEVNDETAEHIDRLEGHPRWYQRKEIKILNRDNNEEVDAWLYFMELDENRKKELKFHDNGVF